MTEEVTENGDFIGSVVKASGLSGGNRAYADANSAHWAYEQFKTAREFGLVDGMQIKAYDELTYKAAFFALYGAVKGKGIKVNENPSLLNGVDVSEWSDEYKTILAALVSVKLIDKETLKTIKPTDTVIRGEAADYIYKLTTVKDAGAQGGCNGCGSSIGQSTGIIFIVVLVQAIAVIGIINRNRKLKNK